MKRFFFNKFTGLASSSSKSVNYLCKQRENSLRVFSFQELKYATNGFNTMLKIGKGKFGSFYKGSILPPKGKGGHPIVVAIKVLDFQSQGREEWLAEVQFSSTLSHPNLVKLLGYCLEGDKERLLVYEFMPNRSLEDHLFDKTLPTLPWKTRLEIMLGAAQGLAYLHEGLEIQMIYRDFKPSSVLLDTDFHPKLSNFGLVREGYIPHISSLVVGYAAMELVLKGHQRVENDMWNFGIVLYEILTGKRAIEKGRPILIDWVKGYPADSPRFSLIMDQRLMNQYSIRAARKIAKLADRCLNLNPKNRPSMSQIVEALKEALQYVDFNTWVAAYHTNQFA